MSEIIRGSEFRPWNKLVGKPGDLTDAIVAIISLATLEFGMRGIYRKSKLYEIFPRLSKEFPQVLLPYFPGEFSYFLEKAFELGLELGGQYEVEISREGAKKYLNWLESEVGKEYVDRLRPIAERLARMVIS